MFCFSKKDDNGGDGDVDVMSRTDASGRYAIIR